MDEEWEVLPVDPSEADKLVSLEARMPVSIPAQLSNGAGETFPAVVLDVSASGLLAVVDRRFSPLLPVPPGAQLWVEFYLEEVEVKHALLGVVRVQERGMYLLELGCSFALLAARMRTAIRARVSAWACASLHTR